ncbi:reduced folate transporter-like [Polyodon spathula]|uniref:reduced folate transporter-like n=1 Tax=Polyodon spathula TaxID=7913 RepID=UPI001B7DD033|nr:reduced folate transporter-like [Polyodon spathula]
MTVLVPVFLLTDYLRYKPVLIVQSLSYISIWLLLLLGTSLLEMQFMEIFYGITMATRVAYSSYIFSLVTPSLYQRVASYSRTSVLLGVFTSSVLGQFCISVGEVSFGTLSKISLGFVIFSFVLTLFLPWPKQSLFFNRKLWGPEEASSSELDQMNHDCPQPISAKPVSACRNTVFFQMLTELLDVVKLPQLQLWSLWWIFNTAGFYLMTYYSHILWNEIYPTAENKHVYNGAVDAASTLLGAMASFAAGYVTIRWSLWSELVIGIVTAHQAGLLLLMSTTSNIWVCYITSALFRSSYQFLVPIATFQIASSITKELCALVFGVNTFLATVLKTIIIIIVADKRGLALAVHSQFLVYSGYFTLLAVIYFGAAANVLIKHFCNVKPATPNQNGDTELCSTVMVTSDAEKLNNGKV